jgi:PAS domain S-box-containing protein
MGHAPQSRKPETQIFQDIFNASPIGIAVESFEGKPLFVNPAFCSFLGFSEKELRRKRRVDFSPREDAEKDRALFQQLKAGSIDHYQMEKRYFRKDGSLVWGSSSISLLSSHPSPLVIAMVEDITDYKRAEESLLHTSEERLARANDRLHLAIESASVGGWDYDLKTGQNLWFGKAHDQLGMAPNETSGSVDEFWDHVHQDDRERLRRAFQLAKDRHEPFTEDFRVVWRDGTTHWLHSQGRYHYGANGQPERMLGISLDITEKRLAEEARFRHAAILESSEDGISSVTRDGVIVTWNAGAQRMFGYTENEAVGKLATIIVPPELQDQQQNKIFERLWGGGRIEQFETVRVSKTGKRIDVSLSISPVKNSSGKIVGCAGIARDITNRKRAAEALQSSEQRYRLLFERNVAGVAIGSLDGRVLDCNDGWARILGYQSRDELLGRHASEFYFNPSDRQPLLDELRERQAVFSRELQLKRKDGGPVWVLFNAAALDAEHSTPILQTTMIDISGWKRAEDALSEMTRKLIAAQEQERVRIGRELHDDINQRLAMLGVELEQLQENPSEVQSRVRELRKHTTELSNDVQALSHDLHSSKLEYLGVVAGMKSWCKDFAERQKLEIGFRSDVSSPLRELGISLFRVLQEALQNGVKHSGVKRIEVQLREDSDEIHLIVRDSGKGFDVKAALKGKGLGLTSMRERVRLINGTINIESKPGSGTTIHIRVPLASSRREPV